MTKLSQFLLVSLCSFYVSTCVYGQSDRFEITYPRKGEFDCHILDKEGFLWTVEGEGDENIFSKYDGHSFIESIYIKKKRGDFVGKLILLDDQFLFSDEDQLILFNPSSSESEVVWEIPDDNHFVDSYLDDLSRIWIFTKSESGESCLYGIVSYLG